ncbi:hypothetical protein niasHS_008289 [Heterodera schachtii]|uniref:SSD domain-containing protein n=1 Tax=Heterodera schachtii TaxID=97005 RepID=A0ABD2J140_HETSC
MSLDMLAEFCDFNYAIILAGYLLMLLYALMSILTTSFNNIFAFWAGAILPVPALRSFCGQTAILLTTNLFGIFFIYPAFIALDLKRRKAGRRGTMTFRLLSQNRTFRLLSQNLTFRLLDISHTDTLPTRHFAY